jgi:glycosyltransferase involved in cell wall biosynthesis
MNSEQGTLVILTPGFPQSEADTTCLPMQQQLVKNIKENFPGLDIIVLSFQYPFLKKTYKWFDIPVISHGGKNRGGLARLLLWYKLNTTLKDLRRNNNIIGVLSFWYGECAWVGKNFANKNNIKHFCWILGQDAKKSNKYIKYLRLKASELIALSDFIQDKFEKNHGTRPQFMIPPGIDPKQFNHPIQEKDIDIIAVGSLIPLKQYGIFVEVIAEIKKHIPGIKAMLIGDGPEKNKLQRLIVSNGLESNITLTGELSHPEVLQHMQRGKVFLHPSSYEGFGVVCIEALYAGCQVISFCRPMKQDIQNWHIVKTKEEMYENSLNLLRDNHPKFESVLVYPIEDSAKAIMRLFN